MLAGIEFTLLETTEKPEDGAEDSEPLAEGAEPGEDDEPLTAEELEKQLRNRREVRFSRAMQNSSRHTHELLLLAEAFDAIREQVINNRIDGDGQYRTRLKDGIADPLRSIAEGMFPELQQRLENFQVVLHDPDSGPEALTLAVVQVDEILAEMEVVLQQMLELESYNRLIEILEEIIREQQKLREETDKLRKESIRSDLL
jgi:hypothetical protein